MKCNLGRVIAVSMGLLFILVFSYCSKSKSAPTVISQYEGSISAQAGSASFQSTQLINATDIGGVMYLAGKQLTAGDSAAIQLTFPDSLLANSTYQDTAGKLFVFTYFDTQQGLNCRSGYGKPAGTLVITSYSRSAHTISGNFTGHVYPGGNGALPAVSITNGAFSATYVPYP